MAKKTYEKVTAENNPAAFALVQAAATVGSMVCDALNHNDPNGCDNPTCFNYASPRERIHRSLTAWIATWATAPYGVIMDLIASPRGSGKGRIITFGLVRTLDATVTIWSDKCLELKSSRGEDITFTSVEDFRQHCMHTYGAPRDGYHG